MTRPCVTHHHACDCREAEFAGIVAELASLREDRDSQQRQAIQMMTQRDALQAKIDTSPVAIMDKREWLSLCAPTEEDFPALYALQGKAVALVVVE
jgi:hypothetical protein